MSVGDDVTMNGKSNRKGNEIYLPTPLEIVASSKCVSLDIGNYSLSPVHKKLYKDNASRRE